VLIKADLLHVDLKEKEIKKAEKKIAIKLPTESGVKA
jgi:hypothetical protein